MNNMKFFIFDRILELNFSSRHSINTHINNDEGGYRRRSLLRDAAHVCVCVCVRESEGE